MHCRTNEAYEAYRARGVMKDGRRFGKPPTPYTPPATPEGKVNITDPDSRNVKTPRGYMQGYNAQAVCNKNQIVVAPEINGWDGGRYEFMRRALETDLGKQFYGKRQVTIEPVFAHTKFNRFLRRGRSACRSEWRLITATHNLLKLHRSQNALATA